MTQSARQHLAISSLDHLQPMLDERRLRRAVSDWSYEAGRRIAVRRRDLGWKQQKLAALVGVSFTSISKFELGLATPKDSTRWAIACALMCEVTDIWPAPSRTHIHAVALSLESVA